MKSSLSIKPNGAKVFAVALLALTAFAAVTAASASANYRIVGASNGGIYSGNLIAEGTFKTDVGLIKCRTQTLSGSQNTETAAELTLHPSFGNCTVGGLSTILVNNYCNYQFSNTSPGEYTASLGIKCSGGTMVYKDTFGKGCEVKIGEQSPNGHVAFTNEPDTGAVLASFNITGIRYSWTAACPNAKAAGEASNGTYVGSYRLVASGPFTVE